VSRDTIERQYAALGTKVETLPTPEQFARIHASRNLAVGGGGRMEDAVISIKCLCPFDILEDSEIDDNDKKAGFFECHRSAVTRFRAAYLAFSTAMGSHYGGLNDSSRDETTGIPLDKLYAMLVRQISNKRMKALKMLIEPLPDGADQALIERHRNFLYPQKHYAEDAIRALGVTLEAIEREEQRKADVIERRAKLDAEWLARNDRPQQN
jgi:hypothetical protein